MTVVIESIVANGLKSDTARDSDVQLQWSWASGPDAEVKVGTVLEKDDWIGTKDDDQVVLRVRYDGKESDDLVFLDPRSHVTIGSVCATAGRILLWVSSRFRLCTRWGTLGVSGTEFEVEVKENELTVLVYEGAVSLDQTRRVESAMTTPAVAATPVPDEAASPKPSPPRVVLGEAFAEVRETVPAGKSLKVLADGRVQSSNLVPSERAAGVDRWSDQIIKASQKPGGVTKGFVNYSEQRRALAFKQARRQALLDNSDKGYLDMAQALNDWDNGAAAEKSLSKVKDAPVRDSQEFMVNEAEAQRLQGNLSKAAIQIEKTLVRHPSYAPAYYVSGKISETKASSDPANKVQDLEAAKISFHKALENDKGKTLINKQAVEGDLDKTIDALGKDAQLKPAWLSSGNRWFTADTSKRVTYSGTASLKVGSTQASGDAVLSIFGDQFKLKTGAKIFTGRITGSPHSRGISFTMTFDILRRPNRTAEKVVISVIGTKVANGIVLQSVPNRLKSFSFRSRNRFR